MSMGKQHPEEIRQQAIALMRDGHSSAEIARRLNVPRGTVAGWRLQAGFEPIQVSTHDPALKEQARNLYLDGIGPHTIAARLNVSLSAVGVWTRGLPPMRRRHGGRATYSASDARRALARLRDGYTLDEASAELKIPRTVIARWAEGEQKQRQAQMRPTIRERYQMTDPVRELAISGNWR